jgi:hypothetical protein
MRNEIPRRSVIGAGIAAAAAHLMLPCERNASAEGIITGDGEAAIYLRDRQFSDPLRAKLAGDVDAQRNLSSDEIDAVLSLSEVLTDQIADADRSKSIRGRAAQGLALIGHVHCLPSLCSVILDRQEERSLRLSCVGCLSYILDKRAVRAIIDYGFGVVAQEHPQSYFDMQHTLDQMIVTPVESVKPFEKQPSEFPNRPAWVAAKAMFAHEQWTHWWKENRHRPLQLQRAVRGAY